MARRFKELCGPGLCQYFVTDRYRKNPPSRQSMLRQTSHVARRWCTVDGGETGYNVPCHIRPDDDRLDGSAPGGDRLVEWDGQSE
jgi:hypothetical protein